MPLHMKAWEHAITQAGGVWNYDFIFSKKGMQGKDILALYNKSFGFDLDVEYTARVKQEYFHKHCAEMKPIDTVVDIVHQYASRLPMAIASVVREKCIALFKIDWIEEYFGYYYYG